MKKLNLFFVFAFVLALVPSAFAMQCKEGNLGPDECWTNVEVSPLETTPVIAGTVLVADFASNNGDTDTAGYRVRVSTTSNDGYKVLGIAQKTIPTGDSGLVLVRGKGKLRITGNAVSSDRLFVSSTAGTASKAISGSTVDVASHDKVLAFALTTFSNAFGSTEDAYITIV